MIVYSPVRSINVLSHGMAFASLAVNSPYLSFCFLLFLQVLQILMWVRMVSLELGQY